MSVRARLGWMVRGGAATNAALESVSADVRALQLRVDELAAAVHGLQRDQGRLDQRQLDELDAIRTAVAAATDDLVQRLGAFEDRTASS